jgi:hypothetical protein
MSIILISQLKLLKKRKRTQILSLKNQDLELVKKGLMTCQPKYLSKTLRMTISSKKFRKSTDNKKREKI